MSRTLTVAVLRDKYPTKFNIPRASRHRIVWKNFLPTNKISNRIEGLTVISPGDYDIGHFVNRIPMNVRKPFVMSFESHLPRYFGGEKTALFSLMRGCLAAPRCRRIVAMSRFAERIFIRQHAEAPERASLLDKLETIYPSLVLPEWEPADASPAVPLRLLFVGSHFGRKGGAVAARAAEIARQRRLPLRFEIVSSLGVESWVDPRVPGFYEPYFRLLSGDNVEFSRELPNAEVIARLRRSHFAVLTTFSDTFGYSAIEAMAVGTPVIATPQGALPEFVEHEANGLMLDLPVDEVGEWLHIARSDKDSPAYAELFRGEIERLARELVEAVEPYCDDPDRLVAMRFAARRTAGTMFDSRQTGPRLDALYERCLAG